MIAIDSPRKPGIWVRKGESLSGWFRYKQDDRDEVGMYDFCDYRESAYTFVNQTFWSRPIML